MGKFGIDGGRCGGILVDISAGEVHAARVPRCELSEEVMEQVAELPLLLIH